MKRLEFLFIPLLLPLWCLCQDTISTNEKNVIEKIDTNIFGEQVLYIINTNKKRGTFTIFHKSGGVRKIGQISKQYKKIGKAKVFDINGQLLRIENYDKGTWKIYQHDKYPYQRAVDEARNTADKYFIKTFGKKFLKKHVVLDFNNSILLFPENTNIRPYYPIVAEPISAKPTQYYFQYLLKLDKKIFYGSYFNIDIDSLNNFKVFGIECKKGFKLEKWKKVFHISKKSALKKVKSLTNIDISKARINLMFNDYANNDYCDFTYEVTLEIKTYTESGPQKNGSYAHVTEYNIYRFNPWNGKYLGIQKMTSTSYIKKE